MGYVEYLLLAFMHPIEFRSLIQYSLYHEHHRDLAATKEVATSGWGRETMRECWGFLDKTSRSFAAVIKQLDGDLARTICLFYLVLRGLDTIEDDMSIPDEKKQPLLRNFHTFLSQPGWTFDGCGPNEKDRELLTRFHVVITELGHIDTTSRDIIIDITQKMARGMADFAHKDTMAASSSNPDAKYVANIEEFDLYCHYVAGLVGEGLSGLFVSTGKEEKWIAKQLSLANSMGLLLQKTNILRDMAEDVAEGRYFWPKSIWSAQGLVDIRDLTKPLNKEKALWALSGMTLDAMRHVTDSLDYLTLLKNQSVFNFCAIPAVMALATLDVCFMNPNVLSRNVKIRKGQAVQLIMKSTNPRDVAFLCRDYTRSIHQKCVTADPYFMKLSVMCGRIEQWTEHHYPAIISFVSRGVNGTASAEVSTDPTDARLRIMKRELAVGNIEKKAIQAANGLGPTTTAEIPQEELPKMLYVIVLGGMALTMGVGMIIVYATLWYFGGLEDIMRRDGGANGGMLHDL